MYSKREIGWQQHFDFVLIDITAMTLALFTGYVVRHGIVVSGLFEPHNIYTRMFIMLILIDAAVGAIKESYKNIVRRGYANELVHTLRHCICVDGLLLACLFFMSYSGSYSRVTMGVYFILHIVFTYIGRCARKYVVRKKRIEDPGIEQMLIITEPKHAYSCVKELVSDIYANYQIKGVIICKEPDDNTVIPDEIEGVPVVCEYDELSGYLLNNVVDSVFIRIHLDPDEKGKVIQMFTDAGITVHYVLTKLENGYFSKAIEQIGRYSVMTTSMRIASKKDLVLKRAVDIAGGIVGTMFTGILALIFGPIIYFQSPGPIIFTQERVGTNGRSFRIYKFRSMYMDAEKRKKELMEQNEMQGFMFKMENDPRIIPIGRFIRKFSIDEFPQFINVLKGDMSLVGTRPPTKDEYEQYSLHHKGRLGSTPGITGLWQVSGRSDIVDFEKVVQLDTEYIENWSFKNDVKIILKTIKQMVKGSGAK